MSQVIVFESGIYGLDSFSAEDGYMSGEVKK